MSEVPALTAEEIEAENERQCVVSLRWRQKHVIDFKPSPSNIAAMGNYIAKNKLPWAENSLEQAFEALQDTLEPITSADIEAQSKIISRQIADSSKPDVPWPQPLNKQSINTIQPKDFRKWMKDPRFIEQINATVRR